MAIPSLAAKAYLTLFQNPHMQPEGYSVDYSDLSAPARLIQRTQRRRNLLNRAATTINKLIRAFRVRAFVAGLSRASYNYHTTRYVNDTGKNNFPAKAPADQHHFSFSTAEASCVETLGHRLPCWDCMTSRLPTTRSLAPHVATSSP